MISGLKCQSGHYFTNHPPTPSLNFETFVIYGTIVVVHMMQAVKLKISRYISFISWLQDEFPLTNSDWTVRGTGVGWHGLDCKIGSNVCRMFLLLRNIRKKMSRDLHQKFIHIHLPIITNASNMSDLLCRSICFFLMMQMYYFFYLSIFYILFT